MLLAHFFQFASIHLKAKDWCDYYSLNQPGYCSCYHLRPSDPVYFTEISVIQSTPWYCSKFKLTSGLGRLPQSLCPGMCSYHRSCRPTWQGLSAVRTCVSSTASLSLCCCCAMERKAEQLLFQFNYGVHAHESKVQQNPSGLAWYRPNTACEGDCCVLITSPALDIMSL